MGRLDRWCGRDVTQSTRIRRVPRRSFTRGRRGDEMVRVGGHVVIGHVPAPVTEPRRLPVNSFGGSGSSVQDRPQPPSDGVRRHHRRSRARPSCYVEYRYRRLAVRGSEAGESVNASVTGGCLNSTKPSTEVLSVSVTRFIRATRREIQNIVQRVSRVRERPPPIQVPKRGIRMYRLREPLPSGVGRKANGSLIRPIAVSGRVLGRVAWASHGVHRNWPRRTAVTEDSPRRRAPRPAGPRAHIRTTGRRGRIPLFGE